LAGRIDGRPNFALNRISKRVVSFIGLLMGSDSGSLASESRRWLSKDTTVAVAITILFFLYFLYMKLSQYAAFQIGYELSHYEIYIWNSLHGRILQIPCQQVSFLGEHFVPILLALVPVYALFQSPYTLLAAHAAGCAVAIIPLYRLAMDMLGSRAGAVFLAIAYGVSRTVNYGAAYDIHPEVLYPFLFLCAFIAMRKERWGWFAVWLVLASCIKEDAFIPIAGIGAYLCVYKRTRRVGIWTLAGAAAALVLIVCIVLPMFSGAGAGDGYRYATYWSGYGNTQWEILVNMLNPVRQVSVLFTPDKLARMFNMFSVLLFLPLLAGPVTLFFVLPVWYMLFSSNLGEMNGSSLYYGMIALPFLYYAAVEALSRIQRKKFRFSGRAVPILACIVLLIQFGNSRVFKQVFRNEWKVKPQYVQTAPALCSQIEPGRSVSAQVNLVSHIQVRECKVVFPARIDEVDYVFLDRSAITWPMTQERYDAVTDSLLACPDWLTLVRKDSLILMKRIR
jgi:uncharacterized membrane protein